MIINGREYISNGWLYKTVIILIDLETGAEVYFNTETKQWVKFGDDK